MKRLFLIPLAVALLFIFFSFGSKHRILAIPIPAHLEDVVVVIEDAIQRGSTSQFILRGTGFLVEDTITHTAFLVTNRHVFQGRDTVFVRFNTVDGTTRRKIAYLVNNRGTPFWRGHPDTTIDVAAVPAPRELNVRILDIERFKKLSDVRVGDEVYFVGFPLLEFTGKDKNYPVLRHGVVSFISKEDIFSIIHPDSVILHKNMLLIDATSLPGNSGSPVLSPPSSETERTALVGLIQGHLSNPITNENLDFGIVIPADRILETIATFH